MIFRGKKLRKSKGQMTLIGIISVLISLIMISLVFMPIYKDLVANSTSGWNSGETLLFRSLGVILLLGLVMGILWYSSAVRERVYQ